MHSETLGAAVRARCYNICVALNGLKVLISLTEGVSIEHDVCLAADACPTKPHR